MIQCLCKELTLPENEDEDLLHILTFVNHRMALNYKSFVPGNYEFDKKKQIGSIVSSLTKLFYLTPKNLK